FVLEKNNKYYKDLSTFVFSIDRAEKLKDVGIQWPVLTGFTSKHSDVFNRIHLHEEKKVVKIREIDANWRSIKSNSCWGCKANVGKNIVVDLYICLQNSVLKIDVITPVFLCIVSYDSSGEVLTVIGCEWLNINKWKEKLQTLAERNLERKIDASEHSYKDFAFTFQGFSNEEKMSYLSKKLGISTPKYHGKESKHWNTRREIWHFLILVYIINKSKIKTINLPRLAEDKWLEALTGWPKDEGSVKQRTIDLWYWFKDLEKKGIVHHTNKQWFSIKMKEKG
ncbi:hypothetical protein, partial [Desulfocastanea catecholica]